MTKRRSGFYVTAREGHRTAYLCGPFDSVTAATKMVPAVSYAARKHMTDPRYQFAGYGVTKLSAETLPPGRLDLSAVVDDDWVTRVIYGLS